MNFLTLILGALLTENLFYGALCGSVFGGKNACVKNAACIALSTLIVSTLSCLLTSIVNALILAPLHAEVLQLLVLAAFVLILIQVGYRICAAKHPRCDGLWLPVLIGSIAVGIAVRLQSGVFLALCALCTAIGYCVVLILMTGVRDRLDSSKIPASMKGLPISLITAGLMTLAFMGFTGLA